MIRPVYGYNMPDFKVACTLQRIFGAKNMASLRCYGLNSNEASFWIAYQQQKPIAGITLQNGVAAISSNGTIDTDELLDFCKQNNVKEIESCLEDIEKIYKRGIGEKDSSWFMEYLKKETPTNYIEMKSCHDLKDMFDVLQKSHPFYQEHYTFETWSKDVAKRTAANESEEYILEIDGEIIGCGSVGAIDEEVATVSSIAVVPEKRCHGYGSGITMFITKRILELGRKPVLIAGYDEVAELYVKLGFDKCGKWGELYL